MLLLLSPAKSLDYDTPVPADLPATEPVFGPQSKALIALLRTRSPQQIAELMSLSDTLSALNVARYQAWSPRATAANSRQAVWAFDGDVYGGLDARSLTADELAWAQDHVAILSGLYGVLRPLDRLQPYRLEMGPRLQADRTPVLVNLASQEYFRAVDKLVLKARVIDCVFEDWKNGQYKIISFHAKRARGLMARHVVKTRAATPRQLEGFDAEGYRFDADASQPDRLVFRRRAD